MKQLELTDYCGELLLVEDHAQARKAGGDKIPHVCLTQWLDGPSGGEDCEVAFDATQVQELHTWLGAWLKKNPATSKAGE